MTHLKLGVAILFIGLFSPALYAAEYPQPGLLMEAKELTDTDLGSLTILDVRSLAAYEAGHVPGALWLDHDAWAKAFGDGDDTEAWAKRIGAMGISGKSQVVIYDDTKNKNAARIWWQLRYWGVQDVRLLNGGWKAWQSEKYAISTKAIAPQPRVFEAKPNLKLHTTGDALLSLLENKPNFLQIVDARSEAEYCGTEVMKNKRGGALPGAKLLEWTDLIDDATHRFKSPEELKKLFAEAGIDPSKPTATHCQSGGRASVMAFGLELMGAKDVQNYYKGWSEWGNRSDTPITQPKPKKD